MALAVVVTGAAALSGSDQQKQTNDGQQVTQRVYRMSSMPSPCNDGDGHSTGVGMDIVVAAVADNFVVVVAVVMVVFVFDGIELGPVLASAA